MIRFALYCRETGCKNGQWFFEPFGNGMNVSDPDEEVICWFAHREAENRFILPSFWRSIKKVGFIKDDGSTIWFEPDSKAVAKIKTYLDAALAAQGTGA